MADLHALDVSTPPPGWTWACKYKWLTTWDWQTLSIFMVCVLGKKYTNPSSDIIDVLAGLDHIDTIFADFVAALDSIIRNGRSCQYIE